MISKPDIQDEKIIACLWQDYGLRISQIVFLPIGGDLSTAVYRAGAEGETLYFCKLRRGDFNAVSVELPQFLSAQGITAIIPPLVTKTGRLWAELEPYHLIVYPFIEGTNGFEIELAERQWADFGAALKRMHTLRAPPALGAKLSKEGYSSEWRDRSRSFIQRIDKGVAGDPIITGLYDFFAPRRETFLDLLGHAERLASELTADPPELVLCHSDIHPGNLFIEKSGALFIVDWDYPMLAPKERDLMFVGGGQGYMGTTALDEETHFYRYYGPPSIHPAAMAYYRCERNLIDLSVECGRIFSSSVSAEDRAKSLQIITWLFLPGGSIDMAYHSLV